MLKWKLSCTVIAICLMASCGKDKKKKGATAPPPSDPSSEIPTGTPPPIYPSPGADAQDLTYRHLGSNCDTGLQTFTTLEQLCQGLVNETLNRSCAYTERLADYTSRCASLYGEPPYNPSYPNQTPNPGSYDYDDYDQPNYPYYPGTSNRGRSSC